MARLGNIPPSDSDNMYFWDRRRHIEQLQEEIEKEHKAKAGQEESLAKAFQGFAANITRGRRR